jgi:FAD/FMN-containing dehydrogenase
VRAARERDLEIGVRCGGHNIAGLAVPHGGLMIDLTMMGRVTVDPVTRRARVQGGAMLGALDRAAQPFGLATTAGNVSHTGVGGLTLGGGMGWLARRHGLACDNVVSCTVVTAGGDVVRASADEHPDLFWGLRGGGGNFGIVVEFEFRLHPVGTRALVAELTFPLDRAAAALRGWRDLAGDAARHATLTAEGRCRDARRRGPGRVHHPGGNEPGLGSVAPVGRSCLVCSCQPARSRRTMLRARRFRDLGKAASRTGQGTAQCGPVSSPL